MKKALTMLLTLLAALTLLAGTAIADDPLPTTEFNDHDFFDTLLVLDPDASTADFEVSVSIARITDDVKNHVKTETLKNTTPVVTNLKEWNWTNRQDKQTIDATRYSRFVNQNVKYVSFETKDAKIDDDAAKNATIKVVYPYIGTYGGKKVGMELLITNIVPANYVWNPNTLWPARFQIAERPNYGIIMHNVHSADYDITLKYTDEDKIVEADDLYLTWSSLSYYYEMIFGEKNCFKEMVSPLAPVDYVYTVNDSNIRQNPEVGMGYLSRRDGTGNFVSTPLGKTDSNRYYAPFSGENKEADGNEYKDIVGHHTFPRNAVGFHFSNSAHMKTRVLSYANSMWFTLYPLGLTATTPNAPQGILLAASKEVAKENKTGKAQSSNTAIVTPGGEFEFVVSQKVNNLNYDSLIRYFSMQMAAVLPEEVDADTISCTLTNDQGENIAANADIMDNAKVNLNQSGEDWALLAAGDSNYDSSKEKNAVVANFKPDWLKNKDGMPLKGEQYYLTVKGKVKEGVADGTVLTFQGVSSFNKKKTLVTEETCKVLDQNTRLELESLNDVFKYEITTRVPQDAVSLTITDTLADVLEVVGMPSVNSTASGGININGNMVTCKFVDVTSDRGKPITLTITAKIKDGVTFQQLYNKYGVGKKETQIPNQAVASYQLKNNATTKINTNKVVVVPLAGLSLTKLVGDTFDTGNGTGVHPQVNSIPQAFQNDEFTFQVTLTDGQDQPLTGSYPLLINGADKGTITNGGTVKLKANQKFTIQKLPVGSKYSITETDIPKHWHKTTEANTVGVTVADTDAYIANALPLTSVSVRKEWDDANNQDGKRPNEITVTLNADGEAQESVVLNEANGWKHTFENLPAKDIKYTVTETVPKDYSMFQQGEGTDNVKITNKYTPGKTSVAVLKHWDDGHDQDGKRPASVTVELLADGVPTGKTLTLDAAGAWGGIFEDLDDMKDGQDIVYTVQETNVPTGYAATVTGSADTRFEITNTQIQDITVTKVWKDDNAPEGLRPHAIKVTLLADGEECEVQEIEPDADGNWTHTFKDMPKYKGGKEITYTVKEHEHDNSEKYTSTVTGDVKQGFTITNTYITKPEPQPPTPYYPDEPGGFTNCITFTKEWRGDVGDHIDYTMYYPDGSIRVNRLPLKYKKSETEWVYEGYVSSPGEYYIIEDAMPGYKVRYENVAPYENVKDRCYNGGRIINYKVPKTGDTASPALWIGLAVLGLGGLSALTLRKRRKALR